jgi:hypothetical protein
VDPKRGSLYVGTGNNYEVPLLANLKNSPGNRLLENLVIQAPDGVEMGEGNGKSGS